MNSWPPRLGSVSCGSVRSQEAITGGRTGPNAMTTTISCGRLPLPFRLPRKEPGTAAPVYERFAVNGDGKHDDGSGGTGAEDDDSRRQQQLQDVEKNQEGDKNGSISISSQQQQGVTGVGKRPRPPSRRPPSAFSLDPVTVRGRPLATGERIRGATVSTPPLRKLLFSATLTNNPQKLAGLDVVNPLIYTATEVSTAAGESRRAASGGEDAKRPSQETRRSNLDEVGVAVGGGGRFSTPATLEETYTVCDSQVGWWC